MWNPFTKKVETAEKASPAQKNYNLRLFLIKIGFVALFLAAAVRLVQIQVIESGKFQELAKKQYEQPMPILAQRGNIYDRNGNVLATNSQFVRFTVNPQIAGDYAKFIAKEFSSITGKPEREYLEKLLSNKKYAVLERQLRPDLAEKIPLKKMPGVVKEQAPIRLYHYDDILGQVLGATNSENSGVSGIEQQYDNVLRGTNGYVVMQRDGLRRTRLSTEFPRQDAVNGHSIELTIDLTYQSIAEEELKKGVLKMQADAGLVVMLRPQTGEVLAMANYPSVNLNKIENADLLKNRIVSDMYEPGSVFKIVTASAALQSGVMSLEKKIYAENGKFIVPIGGNKTRIISDTHPMRDITFLESMAYSSNIVMAKVGDLIGSEKLYNQARNFGFGMTTGIELPAEIGGQLKKPIEWSGTTLHTMAYGYEVGVTPLQIANAYAAIANDGVLMKPYIVKREIDELGNEVYSGQPQMIRRVIPREINNEVKKMLSAVVEFGTGSVVKNPNVTIAGKTGTARKYVNGKYEEGSYNASFVGFFPVEKPELVCLVILEKPKAGGYTGAVASAPIFKGIVERIINNNGLIAKTITIEQPIAENSANTASTVKIPELVGMSGNDAKLMLEKNGFQMKIFGSGDEVVRQYPTAGTKAERGTVVQIMMNEIEQPLFSGGAKVPELRGMSVRRAVNKLAAEHLSAAIVGSGVVVSQFPGAGILMKANTKVTLMCEPKPIVTAQLY